LNSLLRSLRAPDQGGKQARGRSDEHLDKSLPAA